MPGYYDYVLALIPLTLFGLSGTLLTVGLSLTASMSAAAIACVLLVLHALFVNGPVVDTAEHAAPADDTAAVAAD